MRRPFARDFFAEDSLGVNACCQRFLRRWFRPLLEPAIPGGDAPPVLSLRVVNGGRSVPGVW